MRWVVALWALGFVGVCGLYVVSVGGGPGWLSVVLLVLALTSVGCLMVMARDGVEYRSGHRKWRGVVEVTKTWVNSGRHNVPTGLFVRACDDPVLNLIWKDVQAKEQEWEKGDHSER